MANLITYNSFIGVRSNKTISEDTSVGDLNPTTLSYEEMLVEETLSKLVKTKSFVNYTKDIKEKFIKEKGTFTNLSKKYAKYIK